MIKGWFYSLNLCMSEFNDALKETVKIFTFTQFYAFLVFNCNLSSCIPNTFSIRLSLSSLSSPLHSLLVHLFIALRWLWPFPVALHYQTLISLLVQPSGHPWGHFTEVDISDNVLPVTQVSRKQRRARARTLFAWHIMIRSVRAWQRCGRWNKLKCP